MFLVTNTWGYSSAGRALAWHARGQEFDPPYLHHKEYDNHAVYELRGYFSFYHSVNCIANSIAFVQNSGKTSHTEMSFRRFFFAIIL